MKRTEILLIIALFALLVISPSLADNLNPFDRLPYMYDSAVPRASNLNPNSFSHTDLYTGSMIYVYDIKVPPGTNGLEPSIKLIYNSQDTLSGSLFLGQGWRLSENYIKRNVNYTPTNKNNDYFQLMLDGSLYDLIYVPGENRFHTKTETFFYIDKKSGASNLNGEYWILRTKDGTTYRFGYSTESELISSKYFGAYNFTTRWYLDLVNDTYNTTIHYHYLKNPFSNNDLGILYLSNINYSNYTKRIEFIYEKSDRPDLRYFYDQGNKIQISRRLEFINITFNKSLVNTYKLEYQNFSFNVDSGISKIILYGTDSVSNITTLDMGYYTPAPLKTESPELNKVPQCSGSTYYGCFVTGDYYGYDNGIRLADVNGDGLTDVVANRNNNRRTWINNGTNWIDNSSWYVPIDYRTSSALYFVIDLYLGNGEYLDNGVRLADVNADGLIDIVRANRNATPYTATYINTGSGWSLADSSWEIPDCSSSSSDGCFIRNSGGWAVYNGVEFADVNGDGLPDLVRGNGKNSPYSKIWINNGHGWTLDSNWKLPACSSSTIASCLMDAARSDNGVRIADLNGDGLADLIRGNAKSDIGPTTNAWINNGTGWEDDSRWEINDGDMYFVDNTAKDKGVRLVDINSDGLPDLVRSNGLNVGPSTRVLINTGQGTSGQGWKQDDIGWGLPRCDNVVKEGCFLDVNGYDNGVRIGDVNGDGLPDLVRANPGSDPYVKTWLGNISKPYLLANLTNEFGGFTSIDYVSSQSFPLGNETCYTPQSILPFNIWFVANKTNIIQNPTQYSETSNYSYSGRSYNYTDKEFRGFCYTRETSPDNSTVQHWFYQDAARQGKELKAELYDSNNKLFKRDENLFDTKSMNGYFILSLNKSSEVFFDGQQIGNRTVNTTYDYDNFGNTVIISHLGDNLVQGDEYYEYYEYLYNTNDSIVNKPKHYFIFDYDNSTILRQTWYQYDYQSYNQNATKGSITRKDAFLNLTSNITTTYIYNSFGNLINEINPNNQNTTYVYGIIDLTNTFADKIINAKNQTTNYYYDMGTGNLLAILNSNNNATNYTYDVLGRIKKEILPPDSFAYPTKNYTYDFSVTPVKVITHQRETSGASGTLDTYQFYDGFNRLIQTKKESDNNNQIVQDIYYDQKGRLSRQSNPYFVSSTDSYSSPNQSISSTNYSYDALDRITVITNPDGTNKTTVYYPTYFVKYNEKGASKLYILDPYNRIVSVQENNQNTTYSTSYYYKTLGEMKYFIDSGNNLVSFAYDNLGRQTRLVDVDLGTWNYAYDANGNLISQKDNKNNTILFGYDQLNRIISKNSSTENITYIYDREKNNTLYQIITSSITTRSSYDDRLRKRGELRTIDNINFVTNWTYDAMDRITSIKFADGSSINYNYGSNGQLSSVTRTGSTGVIDSISYNEMLQIISKNYSNLLNTTYQYYTNNFRLALIKTGNKQDLNYTYDNVGNVIQIGDTINLRIETMTYDDLDRLISSVKRPNSGSNIFNFTYSYNSIGNIMNLTSNGYPRLFSYGSFPVHAPIGIIDNT